MSYIKRFKEISSQDVSSCGGKGASLGELMRAGFPFADGFVLTIDAFGTDRSQREQEVYEAYDKLDAHYVAVRSSATKEDGIDDSFAGQFDTYLFVDKETLIEKIAECHASLDSDRIQAYCESKNINRSEIKVAVVIQKMVNSEVAGVAFTANPITSDMNEIIIEGGFGLGEAVVSGMITPDNYIWNKRTQSITSINIGQQRKKLLLDIDKGGIKEESVESTIQQVQKLSHKHITQLASLSEKIEQHYGKPMDIERALEDDILYILQARPITTLNQLSSINGSTGDDVGNNNSIVAQVKTKYANDKWYRQRFDACPHFMSFLGSAHITTTNKSSYPWGQDIAYVGFSNDTADRYHNLNQLENTATIITEKIIENPDLIDGMVDDYLDAKKKFYDLCDNLKNKDLTKLSKDEIGELYKDIRYNYLQALIPSSLIDGFALTTDVIIANKIQNHLENIGYTGDVSEVFVTLTSPIFHSFLQEEELDFINLLISTNKNPSDEQIKSHQQKYFWIQNNYTNDNILGVEYFQKKKENLKDCDLHAKKEEIIQIPNNNKKKKNELIKSLNITSEIELLLRLTDKFNEAQDRRKKMTFRATHYFSIILQEIANRTQYSLHQLKYSSNTEIDKILNEEITTEDLDKRIERCMFLYTFDNEEVITDANLITELDQMGRGKINKVSVLNGFTACKGNVTGKVCIVQSVQDIHKVEEGDILVAVMTRPDYLPAMQKAIAFVTDEGGITCHAAIVAREMNKACVIGTKIATQTLNDGDIVEVDAHNGIIKMLEQHGNTVPREKVLQRNFPVFGWSGIAYYEYRGLELGPMYRRHDKECIAVYAGEKQRYYILDPNNPYASNMYDITKNINEDFESELDIANKKIYDFVRVQPGSTFSSLNNLNDIHKMACGLMVLGRDVAADIKKRIYEEIPEVSDDLEGYIMTPWEKTGIQREQEYIKALKGGEPDHTLEDLAEKFGYIHQDYLGKPWTKEDYQKVLESDEDIVSQMVSSFDIDGLSAYQQRLIRIFKKMIYTYEEGRNAMVRCLWAMQQTCRSLDIDPDSILYMTVDEVENMAQSENKNLALSPQIQHERKENFVIFFEDKNFKEYKTKHEVESFLQEKNFVRFWDKKTSSLQEFKGTTAFPGYAKGRARIVFDQHDADAVQEGEILISPMTQVEFLGGMRKCAAIVTDEGGIICHAAIVSREFGKPCVLATGLATTAIKNGDLIEVDATNGVVKILEKNTDRLLSRHWKKNRAGQWSLLSCAYFSDNYTVQLKQVLGVGLEESITITKEGFSYCYFDTQYQKDFGLHFAALADKDPSIVDQRSQDFMQQADNILSCIDNLMQQPVNKTNFQIFIDAFNAYGVPHRIVKIVVDYLNPDILQQHLPILEKARLYAEPVYTRTEEYMQYVAEQLAQQYDISSKHILSMTKDQFELFLENGRIPDIALLDKQYSCGLLYSSGKTKTYYFGQDARDHEQTILDTLHNAAVISGQVAYPGTCTGTVRIVTDPKNYKEFNEGDILVTGMTRPEYLPLVEKCGAFVTDAGGILSHAAITARELKKPCIIGTQIATKVLKDGDLVEIDAEKGTIHVTQKAPEVREHYVGEPMRHMGTWTGIPPLDVGTWYAPEVADRLYDMFGLYAGVPVLMDLTGKDAVEYVYIKESSMQQLADRVQEIKANDPKGFEKILVGVYDVLKSVKQYFSLQDITTLSDLTNEELAQRFIDYRSHVHQMSIYDQVVWRNESYLDGQLHKAIQSLGLQPNTEAYNKVLFSMIMPMHTSTIMDEQYAIIQGTNKVESGESSLDDIAQELADQYGRLPAFVAGDERGADHYVAEIQACQSRSMEERQTEIHKYENYTQQTRATIQEYIKTYNMSDDIVQICSDYAYAIDARNEAEYHLGLARRYLRPLCQIIAERLGVVEDELRLLYEEELVDCLLGKKDIQTILSTRKGSYTGFCYDISMKERHMLDSESAEKLLSYCKSTQQTAKKSGHVSASKGVATGAARIVHGPHENHKVQKGDILITQSTTVDYLPAMKLCGAIITEVGGLTCHAAVVARELGIPCIVSYAGAMTEFSDGDIIEVDANTGQIKKNNYST